MHGDSVFVRYATGNISRLDFLRGSFSSPKGSDVRVQIRSPYITREFYDSCDGCGACVEACEEGVLQLRNFSPQNAGKSSDGEQCSDRLTCNRFTRGSKIDVGFTRVVSDSSWVESDLARGDCEQGGEEFSSSLSSSLSSEVLSLSVSYPYMDFDVGYCTFCSDCVDACQTGAMGKDRAAHWGVKAHIDANCFVARGVVCRSCGDACEDDAIKFTMNSSGLLAPVVVDELCSGCGVCAYSCPNGSIAMVYEREVV